jgi:NAD(P)-dependent dehydrogenase (short-subunit alcohol dehydrogenase family)
MGSCVTGSYSRRMTVPAGSPFDLSGHVALVTGGNGGIGLGMADALAAHGADVAIWGTNPDKNDAAIEQLGRHDVELLSVVCDVGDEDAVVQAFADTVGELGRVDSCFVNAGVGGQAPSFVGMSSDEWRRVMRVNLDGAFFTSREAARHMVARAEDGDDAGGSIVFTTSGSAFFGQQSGQHYGASKAGVNSMMKAIAVQHARHGIRCNSILPGWIESDMTAGAFGWDRFVDKVLPRVPARRWGVPADFGGLAVYLASPASSYHTGDVITIDGGYHSF